MRHLSMLFVILFVFNCSSSSEEVEATRTFLEKYEGEVFGKITSFSSYYQRFKNDENSWSEIYIQVQSPGCFSRIISDTEDYIIEVNEEDMLRYRIEQSNISESIIDVNTFEVVGDTLYKTYTRSVNGQNPTVTYDIQSRQFVDIDVLDLCN